MNNLFPTVAPSSGSPGCHSRQCLGLYGLYDESLADQSRKSRNTYKFVIDRNPAAFNKLRWLQVNISNDQFAGIRVSSTREEAFKGCPELSSFVGRQIPQSGPPPPSKTLSIESLLQPAMQLERRGHVDAALDVLYDRVDDMLRKKQFAALDQALSNVDARSLSTDVLIGLLTATLPAKSKLPSRDRLFMDAESSIKSRDEWEAGLLAGLES